MKSKLLAALMLSAGLIGTAFAGAGVTTEFELENGRNGNADSRALSVAPFYKFDNGIKADIKLEGNRDNGHDVAGNNNSIGGLIEARVRKDYALTDRISAGLRLGVGEVLNGSNKAGQTQDFSYYTVEPILTYKATDALSFNTSYRYRNAFSQEDHSYKTNTAKVGVAYKLTQQDEVGAKYFEKYGDTRSNGVEFVYTRGF
jgi:hypothetical protein